MKNIVKASIFKLFKDKTFRVTLIVGAVLAIALSLLFHLVQSNDPSASYIGSGSYMLLTSFNPTQNFGLAIPINCIILIVGEFTFGTIRNKVIVGYRKSYIYFSLFIVSLIFTFTLLILYAGLSVAFGCLINGGWGSFLTAELAGKLILVSFCAYIFVASLALFFASLTRHQGAAIGLTVFILVVFMIASIVSAASVKDLNTLKTIMWFDPLFIESMTSIGGLVPVSINQLFKDDFLAAGIVSPLLYASVFYLLGNFIFSKTDLK